MKISPDTDDFAEDLQAQVEEATAGAEGSVKITADDAELDAILDEVRAKLDELDGTGSQVTLSADDGELDATLDDAKAKLDELDGKTAEPTLTLDKAEFDAGRDEAVADLDELDGAEATATLTLDTSEFDAKMDDAEARLDALKAQSASLNLGGSAGGGGGGSSGGAEGSMLGAALMVGGSMLPGVGGLAAGLGLVGGTAALALGSGVMQSLSAAHQASQNVGMTGAQIAAQNYSNLVQTQQATESVTEAQQQAAENAATSAESIQSAQMNLAEVTRNASASQVQAIQSVTQAEQGVQQATYSLSEANYNLGQAYVQAREAIVNANDALSDSKLNVQSATLAVAQAEYNLTQVNQNAYSTDLDRQQASLAVAQAKQQVTDATAAESQAQVAANLANSQGVAGSQTVIQAKQAQKEAQDSLADSTASYSDAQANLTNTELNNAEQVKQAQMEVAQAQQQAAYQQEQDAESVSDAQRNLTETIKEQKLQWASMLSTQNSSANQFAADFAKLTPAGKAFVDQVLGMSGSFKGLEKAAQTAALPGFTEWLKGVAKLAPGLESAVSQMGKAMGSAFAGFGQQLSSSGAQGVLSGLVTNGMIFADTVLPAFAGFVTQLGLLGSKKGAVSGIADLLGGAFAGLAGFAKGLTPYIPYLDKILVFAGQLAKAFGPALAQEIGQVAKVLALVGGGIADVFKFFHMGGMGGPFISALAHVGGALLLFKGAIKLLPDFISKPLAEAAAKFGGWLATPLKKLGGQLATWGKQALAPITTWAKNAGGTIATWGKNQLSTLATWGKNSVSALGTWAKNAGSTISGWATTATSTIGTWVKQAGGAIAGWATTAASNAATFATNFGSKLATAGGSVATFVSGLGSKLVTAATSMWTFVAANATAAATYIASNVAMAASATAAFIAENAATLGLGVVIAALVTGIVLLATHWKQAWTDMKNWTLDAWHNGIEPAIHGIADLGLWLWHDVFDPVWHGIETTWSQASSFFTRIWGDIEKAFKTPVNFLIGTVYFLIGTVYDKGIARFWNDVVGAIGLGSLKLPVIPQLAGGGFVSGYSPGHDTRIAAVSPGEGILTPQATHAIGGKSAVDSLNSAYPPSSSKPAAGSALGSMAVKLPEKELRKHALERPAEHILSAGKFSLGGVVGDIGGFLGGAAHDVGSFFGGLVDAGKIVADLASGNTTALVNALGKFIGTSAAGALGKIMLGVPKALVGDMTSAILSAFGIGGGSASGGSNAVGSLPANWHTIASYLAGHGFTKYAAAGVAGNVAAESGGRPEQLEIGGGGGGGLIQWTPWQSYGPLITGNASQDLMTQLAAIVTFGGGPATVNRATSPSNAAMLYQDFYERPKNLSASLPGRMASANAVYKAMGWGSYDLGGMWPPGTGGVNSTGQPEAVLNPQQTQWLQQAAQRGAPSEAPPVVVNYNGPQMPTPEENAIIMRDLSLAVGGA